MYCHCGYGGELPVSFGVLKEKIIIVMKRGVKRCFFRKIR